MLSAQEFQNFLNLHIGHVVVTSLCQGLYGDIGFNDIKIARHIIIV